MLLLLGRFMFGCHSLGEMKLIIKSTSRVFTVRLFATAAAAAFVENLNCKVLLSVADDVATLPPDVNVTQLLFHWKQPNVLNCYSVLQLRTCRFLGNWVADWLLKSARASFTYYVRPLTLYDQGCCWEYLVLENFEKKSHVSLSHVTLSYVLYFLSLCYSFSLRA